MVADGTFSGLSEARSLTAMADPEATTSPPAPEQLAQIIATPNLEAIGQVETVVGTARVTRPDGTEAVLRKGDPIYQGDVLETGGDGAVGVILADNSVFSLGEGGRMVLDEMVYDPGAGEGAAVVNLLAGAATFVSGQIAKLSQDAMLVKTPVATIGIRGTKVYLETDGESIEAINLPERTLRGEMVGEIVLYDPSGTVLGTINQLGGGWRWTPGLDGGPRDISLSRDQVDALVEQVSSVLPRTLEEKALDLMERADALRAAAAEARAEGDEARALELEAREAAARQKLDAAIEEAETNLGYEVNMLDADVEGLLQEGLAAGGLGFAGIGGLGGDGTGGGDFLQRLLSLIENPFPNAGDVVAADTTADDVVEDTEDPAAPDDEDDDDGESSDDSGDEDDPEDGDDDPDLADGDDPDDPPGQTNVVAEEVLIPGGAGDDVINVTGNLTATNGNVEITGNGGADAISVNGTIESSLDVIIAGGAGDDVINLAGTVLSGGDDLRVLGDEDGGSGNDGDDTITITARITTDDDVEVFGGGGDDSITIDSPGVTSYDDIEVFGEDGDDAIVLRGVFSALNGRVPGTQSPDENNDDEDIRVAGGAGDDSIELNGTFTAADDILIIGGDGDDTITLAGTFETTGDPRNDDSQTDPVSNDIIVDGGDGDDLITLVNAIDGVWVVGGDGDDVVVFSGASNDYTVATSNGVTFTVHGGDGTATLTGVETLRFDDGDFAIGDFIGATLFGGDGDDTHAYSLADGDVVISDTGGSDTVVLDSFNSFWGATRDGNDLVSVMVDGGTLRIKDHYAGQPVEVFRSAATGETAVAGTGLVMSREGLVVGTAAGETLSANGGVLFGGGGDDTIIGGAVSSEMFGGAGDDILDGGNGDDDTANYSFDVYQGGTLGVTVNLATGEATDGFGDTDTLIGIEDAIGTAFDDHLTAGISGSELAGLGGTDTFIGGRGYDEVSYARDAAFGGDAGVVVDLREGTGTDGFGNVEVLFSIEGIEGTQFADRVSADGINSWFVGLGGADTYIGGAGTDTADYANDAEYGGTGGVTVDLDAYGDGTVIDGFGDTDNLKGIERVKGTHAADTFNSGGYATFMGLAGADSFTGLLFGTVVSYTGDADEGGGQGIVVDLDAGTVIDGFGDTDTLTGINMIEGSAFGDTFGGGGAGGWFFGLAGNDTFTGGNGQDIVDYSRDAWWGGTSGVVVDLGKGVATDGFGHTDTLHDVDEVRATDQDDRLTGGGANEVLKGFAGDDILEGGAGNDILEGGAGSDVFRYAFEALVADAFGSDVIADFAAGDDTIDIALPSAYPSELGLSTDYGHLQSLTGASPSDFKGNFYFADGATSLAAAVRSLNNDVGNLIAPERPVFLFLENTAGGGALYFADAGALKEDSYSLVAAVTYEAGSSAPLSAEDITVS